MFEGLIAINHCICLHTIIQSIRQFKCKGDNSRHNRYGGFYLRLCFRCESLMRFLLLRMRYYYSNIATSLTNYIDIENYMLIQNRCILIPVFFLHIYSAPWTFHTTYRTLIMSDSDNKEISSVKWDLSTILTFCIHIIGVIPALELRTKGSSRAIHVVRQRV